MKELKTIEKIAMNNGYNQKMVHRLNKRKRERDVNSLIFKGTTNTDKNWLAIPYTEISEKISRIIQKREKPHATFSNQNNLGRQF